MESAPATIPATSAGTLIAAFAPPDGHRHRVRDQPVQTAPLGQPITGTSPAHDTRFGSSNTAETP